MRAAPISTRRDPLGVIMWSVHYVKMPYEEVGRKGWAGQTGAKVPAAHIFGGTLPLNHTITRHNS